MSIGPEPGREQGRSGDVDRAQEPLNEREIALVKRLFSDPFTIPIEFYAWLKAKLEADPPLLTTSSIFGFRSQLAATIEASAPTLPVGSIVDYGGSADPDAHWMICDGRTISQAAYPVLFGVIGHTYAPDPGGGNFIIPDFRGRMSVGKGTHADVDTLGENDGAALASRRPKHAHGHSLTLPNHVHGGDAGSNIAESVSFGSTVNSASVDGGDDIHLGSKSVTGNPTTNPAIPGAIGTAGVNETPSYLVVNKVIKVS